MSIASDIVGSSEPKPGDLLQFSPKRAHYVLPHGAIVNGTYEIDSPLGHGGMGEVYKAWHPYLKEYFAIKILLPRIAARNPNLAEIFLQEARLAMRIKHPNFIEVFDANYDSRLNIYFIVMELVDGDSIRTTLRNKGVFSETEALEIALYVGRALEKADGEHIVHRDIKPDNIMLTKDGKVKVADLGIAKSDGETTPVAGDDSKHVTLIGTPAYASPEQIEDAQSVDCRADVYSLGVTLYEMLSGKKPYVGSTQLEIIKNMYSSAVPSLRSSRKDVSAKTVRLIQRAMSKERGKRPGNWTEFCSLVENILGAVKAREIEQTINNETHNSWPDLPLQQLRKSSDARARLKSCVAAAGRFARKYARYVLVAVVLLVAVLAMRKAFSLCGRDLKLVFASQEIKELCKQNNLDLPLQLVFASPTIQRAWIEQQLKDKVKHEAPPEQEKGNRNVQAEAVPLGARSGRIKFVLEAPQHVRKFLAEKSCRLQVESDVTGKRDVAMPGELEFPEGRHSLSFRMRYCEAMESETVEVANGCLERVIEARLLPGSVSVVCGVAGSRVLLDGRPVGGASSVSMDSMVNHELKVEASGYLPYIETVCVGPGEHRRLEVSLKKVVVRESQSWDRELKELADADKAYQSGDYLLAEKLYCKLSDDGNPIASFRLGEMIEKNTGNIDFWAEHQKAFQYYLKAAESHYAPAICRVAEFYERELDYGNALEAYRLGAGYGELGCMKSMGRFYEEGRGGLKQDYDKAIGYYRQAAEATQDRDSYLRLAELYRKKAENARNQGERDSLIQEATKWDIQAKGR